MEEPLAAHRPLRRSHSAEDLRALARLHTPTNQDTRRRGLILDEDLDHIQEELRQGVILSNQEAKYHYRKEQIQEYHQCTTPPPPDPISLTRTYHILDIPDPSPQETLCASLLSKGKKLSQRITHQSFTKKRELRFKQSTTHLEDLSGGTSKSSQPRKETKHKQSPPKQLWLHYPQQLDTHTTTSGSSIAKKQVEIQPLPSQHKKHPTGSIFFKEL